MKLPLKNLLKSALGILAAFSIASCLQNETVITLEKDGSGTIVEETFLGAEALEMMGQFAQPGAPNPLDDMFNEEDAKEHASDFGEGVELVKFERLDIDGRKGARMTYKFADINNIKLEPGSAMDDMADQGNPEAEKDEKDVATFEYADGKLKIKVPPTDYQELSMDDADAEQNPQMEAMMKKMLKDMRITMKLIAAPGIETSSASYTDGDTITLFDVEMGKLLEQKDQLNKITELSKEDQAAAEAEFKKLKGVRIESSQDVTVTLK